MIVRAWFMWRMCWGTSRRRRHRPDAVGVARDFETAKNARDLRAGRKPQPVPALEAGVQVREVELAGVGGLDAMVLDADVGWTGTDERAIEWCVSGGGITAQEGVAEIFKFQAGLDPVKVLREAGGVSHADDADEAVGLQDALLVEAARRVMEGDGLKVLSAEC